MEKFVKTKLKEAKVSFKKGDYEVCYSELQECLEHDSKNYTALVLKGACCERLSMDDAGMDCYFDAITLDSENILAWQGLMQLGSSNTDRYYSVLVYTCMRLLSFYADQQFAEKRFAVSRLLVELMMRYRLELPPVGTGYFRSLCLSVLKMAPSNACALELLLRLKFEYFLANALPYLISPTLVNTEEDRERFLSAVDEMNRPDTLDQITYLESVCTEDEASHTARTTVEVGKLFLRVAVTLKDNPGDSRSTWEHVYKQVDLIELNGLAGFANWCRKGYMDVHAALLYAVAAFKLYNFVQCDRIVAKILVHCKNRKNEACAESRELSLFPTVPLSQLTDFLTPRPMLVPFLTNVNDLSTGAADPSPYALLEEMALMVRMANAATSEHAELASRLAATSVPVLSHEHQYSYLWPSALKTLWIECCLTSNHLDLAANVLFPSNDGSTALESIITSPILSDLWDLRFRLCFLHVAFQLITNSVSADSDAKYAAFQCLLDAALTIVPQLDSSPNARDHFLLARVFDKLGDVITLNQELRTIPITQYKRGIDFDGSYHMNFLYLGKLYRRRLNELDEAITHLSRANELVPDCPQSAYELAVALCQRNQLHKALNAYSSVDKTKFTKEMWLNFGLITLRLGYSLQAVPALQKVVILDPKNPLCWEVLGEAYLLRRSYETAVKTLMRSINLNSTRPLPYILCGRAYRLLGDFYQAESMLTTGLQLSRSLTNSKNTVPSTLTLALKEMVELKLLESHSHIRQGLSGRAIEEFQSTLKHLDVLFELSGSEAPLPVWAYHYVASAFSLLSFINDPDLSLLVPSCFACGSALSGANSNQTPSKVQTVNLLTCLQTACIYYVRALKAWRQTPEYPKGANNFESPRIVTGCLLVTLGLHCISLAKLLNQHPSKIHQKSVLHDPDILCALAEAVFKQTITLLTNSAVVDQRFLDEHVSEETISELDKIAQTERTEEQLVSARLRFNCMLRSYAWHGLASLYFTYKGSVDFNAMIEYCLCQSLITNPTSTESATSLAIRFLHHGHIQTATSLLTQFQSMDSENYLVWLASAHLHAITDTDAKSLQTKAVPVGAINHAVLQDLLQAACLGANVSVAAQLSCQMFYVLIEFVCSKSNETSSPKPLTETTNFVRLALEVAMEALNRALAFEPTNPNFWYDRGLMLQLAGLTDPAEFCLRKALELWSSHIGDNVNHMEMIQRCRCQIFLLSLFRRSPDQSLIDLLADPSVNSDISIGKSVAEAFAKGCVFLRFPRETEDKVLSEKCLVKEPCRLVQLNHPVALATSEAAPNLGHWLLLFEQLNSILAGHMAPNAYSPQLIEALLKSPVHPRLLKTLIALGRQLSSVLPPSDFLLRRIQAVGCCSILEQLNSSTLAHTGHHLAELDSPDPVEFASLALDQAHLISYTSGSRSSGLSYLSRLVALRPDDPDMWTILIKWIAEQPNAADSACTPKRRGAVRSTNWPVLIRLLKSTLVARVETVVCSLLMANALCDCAKLWLSVPTPVQSDDGRILLSALRRACALYPHTPEIVGLLSQLNEKL